jgi:hypothetical protein
MKLKTTGSLTEEQKLRFSYPGWFFAGCEFTKKGCIHQVNFYQSCWFDLTQDDCFGQSRFSKNLKF